VVGREQRSERRWEGRPGYSEEWQVHLHRHRGPITATQPMDIPHTDIRATLSRASGTAAMVNLATRDTPLILVLRGMDTPAIRDSPPTPPRVTDRQATRDTPTPDPRPLRRQATPDSQLTQVVRAMDIRARRPILRTPVTEIRSLAIPAIALRRTGRPGADYAIEPAS
jgi:hypothetical protein